MKDFKILTHEDYEEVVDLCKNIWDGNDYIPEIFHKWVDDKKGCFLAVKNNNKIVGLGKYSILIDNQGWLEGLRVHPDYRGIGYANMLSDELFKIAKKDIEINKTISVGMCTHKDTIASIKMMTNRGFHLEQSCLLAFKDKNSLDKSNIDINDFKVNKWNISYDDLLSLDYFKNFNNRIVYGFMYLNLCKNVYDNLVSTDSLLDINGFKCIIKLKGDTPSIMCINESIESINTLANYCLLKYNSDEVHVCITNPTKDLIDKLRANNFDCIDELEKDCLYFLYK